MINLHFVKKILLIIILPFLLTSCTPQDMQLKYLNTQAINKANNGIFDQAQQLFEQASQTASSLAYLANNNLGISTYQQQGYQSAHDTFTSIIQSDCNADNPKPNCDQIYYNQGNTLYRLGAQQDDTHTKLDFWQQAISAYEQNLQLNPEDTQAQENIDFIKQKMQKEQQNEQNDQSEDNQENNEDSDSENSQKNEHSDDKKNEKSANSDGSNGQSENEEQSEDGQSQSGSTGEQDDEQAGQQGAEHQTQLDPQTDAQVEKYLQQMEQNQQALQQYFKQNPDAQADQPQNPFDDFFNDPFFDNFFQDSLFDRNLGGLPDNNEKDW